MRATGNGGVFCLVSPDRRMRDVEHLMLWKGSASLQAVRAYKHATGRRLWASGFGLWASGFRPQATTMRPARHPLTTYAVPGRENSPVEYFPFGQAAATNNASQAFHVAWYEMEPAQKHATRL